MAEQDFVVRVSFKEAFDVHATDGYFHLYDTLQAAYCIPYISVSSFEQSWPDTSLHIFSHEWS